MLREINGYDVATGRPLSGFTELQRRRLHRRAAAGSTAGCTPTGSTRRPAASPARSRTGWPPSGAGRGRRTGACSTTAPPPTRTGRPWSERKTLRLVGRGARASGPATTCPDFEETKPPTYRPPPGRDRAGGASPATTRSSCRATARAGCTRPAGVARRADADALRAGRVAGAQPALRPAGQPGPQGLRPPGEPDQPEPAAAAQRGLPVRVHGQPAHRAPHRRRDEPARCAYLAELQPEMFVRGVPGAGRRARAGAPGLGAPGHRPRGDRGAGAGHRAAHARCGSTAGSIHQVWLPYHFGLRRAWSTGDSANDLFGITLDPNVLIQESKVGTCDIRPGRRPTGPALLDLRGRLPAAGRASTPDQHAAGHDRRTDSERAGADAA